MAILLVPRKEGIFPSSARKHHDIHQEGKAAPKPCRGTKYNDQPNLEVLNEVVGTKTGHGEEAAL